MSALVNGGMVNDGHALVDGGIIRAHAPLGPAIVQSVIELRHNANGGGCTWTNPTTMGNLLIMVALNSNADSGTLPSGWTSIRTQTDTGVEFCRILTAAGGRFGAESIGSLNADWAVALIEISGLTNGGQVDVGNGHSALGTTVTTGSITTTAAEDFIIACLFTGFNLTDGISASFTELFGGLQNQANQQSIIAYRIPGSTVTVNPQATLSGSNLHGGIIQSFKNA